MDLSQPGCLKDLAYRFLIVSALLSVVYYVVVLGLEVHERKSRESSMQEHWLSECEFQEQIGCDRALDAVREDCLRQSRTSSREGIVFTPKVFFECVNERNDQGVRLTIPEELDDE